MTSSSSPRGRSIEAVIFDKDGTLADACPFLRELAIARAHACAQALWQHAPDQARGYFDSLCTAFGVMLGGLEPNGLMATGTRQANEQAAMDLAVDMGKGLDEVQGLVPHIFADVERAVTCKAAKTPLFEGTRAMLAQLSLRPLKVGVLSSDSPANVLEFLNYYHVEQTVDCWRGTESRDLPKPNPDLFWQLCDRLQVSPHRTLMVGDSWADLEVTRNAGGAAFVSVGEIWGRPPVVGSDYVMTCWDDLLNLVDGYEKVHPAASSLASFSNGSHRKEI